MKNLLRKLRVIWVLLPLLIVELLAGPALGQFSKGNTFENDMLLLIFNNDAIADIGDSGGLQPSSADGSLYIFLSTGDPGEAGNATTNEASYTGYAREAVARTTGGWTVSTNTAENAAAITFGQCTAGTDTITYCGITTAVSGATKILYSGILTAQLAVSSGITPEFAAGDLTVTED